MYYLNAIEVEQCKNSTPGILNKIKVCQICGKVPLPSHRSFKAQKDTYCRICYLSSNHSLDHLINPPDLEYELLGELVISCKNPTCSSQFNVWSLEDLIKHEKICISFENCKVKTCKRCKLSYSNDKFHDCITELKKLIQKPQISNHNNKGQDSINQSLFLQIEELNKKVNNLQSILNNNNYLIKTLMERDNGETLSLQIQELNKKFNQLQNNINSSDLVSTLNDRVSVLERNNISKSSNSIQIKVNKNLENRIENNFQQSCSSQRQSLPIQQNYCINDNTQFQQISNNSPRSFSMNLTIPAASCVNSLLELSDGTIAIGLNDFSIKIWDVKSNKCVKTLRGNSGSIFSMIELPNGRIASANNDYTVKIWDISSASCKMILHGHTGVVSSIIKLKNGGIASGSNDKMIRIWDTRSWKSDKILKGHTEFINAIVELSDGILATGSGDNTIKIWELNSSECIESFQGHKKTVSSLIYLPDFTLISASWDGTIKFWDLRTGINSISIQAHSGFILNMIRLSDGRLATGSNDKTIKIWDINDKKCIKIIEGYKDSVSSLIELSDGSIAGGSYDNTVKIWL